MPRTWQSSQRADSCCPVSGNPVVIWSKFLAPVAAKEGARKSAQDSRASRAAMRRVARQRRRLRFSMVGFEHSAILFMHGILRALSGAGPGCASDKTSTGGPRRIAISGPLKAPAGARENPGERSHRKSHRKRPVPESKSRPASFHSNKGRFYPHPERLEKALRAKPPLCGWPGKAIGLFRLSFHKYRAELSTSTALRGYRSQINRTTGRVPSRRGRRTRPPAVPSRPAAPIAASPKRPRRAP